MCNPFEDLSAQIAELSKNVDELKSITLSRFPKTPSTDNPDDVFIPLATVFEKYIKRSAFYDQVKQGKIKMYKLGKLSFVKADEFYAAFEPAESYT